jgi:hypothetical protein
MLVGVQLYSIARPLTLQKQYLVSCWCLPSDFLMVVLMPRDPAVGFDGKKQA